MTPRWLASTLLVVTVAFGGTARADAQAPRLLLHVGPGAGSGELAGVGVAVGIEQRIATALRVSAQWTNWQALLSCSVEDAPSECDVRAHMWVAGLEYAPGGGEGFTPLLGVGAGIYRRRSPSPGVTSNSPMASATVGMDVGVGATTSLRLAFVYQQVLDDDLAAVYDGDVRVVGVLMGVAVSLW